MGNIYSVQNKYNWKPELPDFRDEIFKYKHINNKLPNNINLKKNFKDYYQEFNNTSETCIGILLDSYNLNYKYDNLNNGETIRNAIKNFSIELPAKSYLNNDENENEKKLYKLDYTKICNFKNQIKQSLYDAYPILFGFTLFESFENIKSDGLIPIPQNNEKIIGGLCCIIIGYDDSTSLWILKHPLGKDFGDNGYLYMPYEMLSKNNNLTTDFWRISRYGKI